VPWQELNTQVDTASDVWTRADKRNLVQPRSLRVRFKKKLFSPQSENRFRKGRGRQGGKTGPGPKPKDWAGQSRSQKRRCANSSENGRQANEQPTQKLSGETRERKEKGSRLRNAKLRTPKILQRSPKETKPGHCTEWVQGHARSGTGIRAHPEKKAGPQISGRPPLRTQRIRNYGATQTGKQCCPCITNSTGISHGREINSTTCHSGCEQDKGEKRHL